MYLYFSGAFVSSIVVSGFRVTLYSAPSILHFMDVAISLPQVSFIIYINVLSEAIDFPFLSTKVTPLLFTVAVIGALSTQNL